MSTGDMGIPAIGAIETTYQGIRFRSRLEARWAVLFDEWGQRWEFEPEGYRHGNIHYLPDFWLPDLECFWEVKREFDSLSEGELDSTLEKIMMLNGLTGKTCMVSFGFPQDAHDANGRVLLLEPDGSELIRPFSAFPGAFLDAAYAARGYRFWDPSS